MPKPRLPWIDGEGVSIDPNKRDIHFYFEVDGMCEDGGPAGADILIGGCRDLPSIEVAAGYLPGVREDVARQMRKTVDQVRPITRQFHRDNYTEEAPDA